MFLDNRIVTFCVSFDHIFPFFEYSDMITRGEGKKTRKNNIGMSWGEGTHWYDVWALPTPQTDKCYYTVNICKCGKWHFLRMWCLLHTLTRGGGTVPPSQSEQLAKNGKTIEQQQATHSSYCTMILRSRWPKFPIFRACGAVAPAAPIGTTGEYLRSNSNKVQQKINQNIPFSSKIPKFRARLRRAKVFSPKKVKVVSFH